MNKQFKGIHGILLVALFIRIALLCVPGCTTSEGLAGGANKSTHQQTVKLATAVNKAQAANTAADAEVVAASADPRLPADLKAHLVKAHSLNQTVQDSLKPIGTAIIPAINSAADDALRAEIMAQSARNSKISFAVAMLVFAGVTLGLQSKGLGWAVSAVAGGIAALVVGLVVGEIAKWIPWIVGIGGAGGIVFLLEKEIKGGWLAALHDRWHVAGDDAVGATVSKLKDIGLAVQDLRARAAAVDPTKGESK